MLNYKYILMG